MVKRKVAIAFLAISFFIGLNFNVINVYAKDIKNITYEETGLNTKYIEYIYKLALNNTQYMDKYYNINKDTVIKSKGAIFNLGDTKYQILSSIRTTGIDRPSEYFMPDSLYSVAYDIKTLMQYRYYKDRGGYQRFFDSYNEDTKQSIVFCEAILEYTGETEENVERFTRAYEMFMTNHTYSIEEALRANGISDNIRVGYLRTIFSLDEALTQYKDLEDAKEVYEMPYIIGYTSRENLLEASFSLVGKVRYTWAGGHALTSTIKGINPIWSKWEQLYEDDSTCIKPSGSYCPLHGYNEDERCISYDLINSYNEYLALRAETFEDESLNSSKYKDMLKTINIEDSTAHRLDGLDCSGYTSWILNQIQHKYSIDSTAMYFTQQEGIESIEFGTDMLPGDIFAWTSHIVVIVGKVNENSKVYVTVEQTPNVLKFGTVYYAGYKQSDLDQAMQIAREANQLIGATDEEPHSYCMNNVGQYSVELSEGQDANSLLGNVKSIETKEVPTSSISENDIANYDQDTNSEEVYTEEEYNEGEVNNTDSIENSNDTTSVETQTVTTVKAQYIDIGRYVDSFVDEDRVIEEYGTSIENLYATDIIKYIITKLPIYYISGYNTYSGSIFDKNTVATNVGTLIIKE